MIEKSPELGGAARVVRIKDLRNRHQQLSAPATIVGPLARLVGQNLLATDAALARDAGEPLKVAHGRHASNPALEHGLATLANWSGEHHRRNHARPHSNGDAQPPTVATAPST